MINKDFREKKQQEKEKIKNRINVEIDPDNYLYIPAKKQVNYYDDDVNQRVAIYARVSTDDIRQTTSYELQKKYYEEFVTRHPNWTLIKIYADEGISGTSLKHRDEFKRMIADCNAGKIDMIITKSVSRFARNVEDFIGTVRRLSELKPRVGVFFESEAIFSLNDDSQMALTFQATMAEEESRIRSRSMETSLRMRLDHGIPLTPKLYGFLHNADGKLEVNPEEAPTVKLMFFMYLYGYSTQQIADTLIQLGRRSYWGLINWTASGISSVLRNERHCGDVVTRKTFTESVTSHRVVKNRGEKPQSWYFNHHTGIVSRDDFNAVQRMLDNSKYRNKAFLPELRVITDGLFKGYVSVNPRWAAFKEGDYFNAALSVYNPDEVEADTEDNATYTVDEGDFDLRGFEITRTELFDSFKKPFVIFTNGRIKFSTDCIKKFNDKNNVEMLVNPIEKKFAIRPTEKTNLNGVIISKLSDGKYVPKEISAAAFFDTLYALFGWNTSYKYRTLGVIVEKGDEIACVFDINDTEAFFKSYVLQKHEDTEEYKSEIKPLTPSGKHIRAIPEKWVDTFGNNFYKHEHPLSDPTAQTKTEWELRMQGQLFEVGKKLNVTGYDELKEYITNQLGDITPKEFNDEQCE